MRIILYFAAIMVVATLLSSCDLGPPDRDGVQALQQPLVTGTTTYERKSVLVTDLSVVNDSARTSDPCLAVPADANKKWTFGYLVAQATNQTETNVTPTAFVNAWLSSWNDGGLKINGYAMTNATDDVVALEWPLANGVRPLEKAPMRLLAIVNRIDKRASRRFGEGLAGELRFVFGTLRPLMPAREAGNRCVINDVLSTVILEYAVDKDDENQVLAWGRAWDNLSTLTLGSATYNSELEKLTESVVKAGVGKKYGRANGSALIRIRTNEGNNNPWFLREFVIDPTSHLPIATTIKQSPGMDYMTANVSDAKQISLGKWIVANKRAILADTYTLPATLGGRSFLGGFNTVNFGDTMRFAPADPGDWEYERARAAFAVNTCAGCHGVETGTTIFHITPRKFAEEAKLSTFMTGQSRKETRTGVTHEEDDLAARAYFLKQLAGELPALPKPGQYYKARFLHSGKCVDIPKASTTAGETAIQWACHGNSNQRFTLIEREAADYKFYNFKNKNSGLCLDVKDASTADLAEVIQAQCDSNKASQRIELIDTWWSDQWILRFKHSGKCLDVAAASSGDGAKLLQYTCELVNDTKPQQRFDFIE